LGDCSRKSTGRKGTTSESTKGVRALPEERQPKKLTVRGVETSFWWSGEGFNRTKVRRLLVGNQLGERRGVVLKIYLKCRGKGQRRVLPGPARKPQKLLWRTSGASV